MAREFTTLESLTTDRCDEVEDEAVALAFQIADLEDAAQNAEDREQLGRASAIRTKLRPLRARINELRAALAAQRAVQS
jgi:hypothetical protein